DKIIAKIVRRNDVVEALATFNDYVCGQTLCTNIEFVNELNGATDVEWGNDEVLTVRIEKL
ncbi:MAG: hypothetical protein RR880_04120, partial [Bacteroidales bacterium]